MSEIQLVVREADRDWSGSIHASWADRAIAALSADPVTLAELESATARFEKPVAYSPFFASFSPRLCDAPHDAGLVIIDLVARLVAVDSTYSSPGPTGAVWYHDGHCSTDARLQYHLADDWLFVRDLNQWQAAAAARRHERASKPLLDVRAIIYGRPMLEFVARETFAVFAQRDEIATAVRAQWIDSARQRLAKQANVSIDDVDPSQLADDEITPQPWPGEERYASPFYDSLKQIHAAWLLTPRQDLGGACLRDVALERREHLSWDLQDRSEQWSRLNECPPGLDEQSFAYRHGGFGTHELVMYYELVRELLWSSWEKLNELCPAPQDTDRRQALAVGDFLATEVSRLKQVRDEWLDTPDPEFAMRTPRSIIHRERARLPEGVTGHEAMIDPDCPCCQMQSDMPGPVFWHLDGSGMDDEFAFDVYHRTREEWEAEQRKWDEDAKRFDAEWSERQRLGLTGTAAGDEISGFSGSVGFADESGSDAPLVVRVFGVGCRLAEIMSDLRAGADGESTPRDIQRQIDQLNRDFGNLRELLMHSEPSTAAALIYPLLDRFTATLDDLAATHPDVALKCESLASDLATLLEDPRRPSDPEYPDSDDPY